MRDYMMALYTRFCTPYTPSEQEKQLEQHLKSQLSKEQRKRLLRLTDYRNMARDDFGFEAFISGFRLATGIAIELGDNWYSIIAEENHKSRNPQTP